MRSLSLDSYISRRLMNIDNALCPSVWKSMSFWGISLFAIAALGAMVSAYASFVNKGALIIWALLVLVVVFSYVWYLVGRALLVKMDKAVGGGNAYVHGGLGMASDVITTLTGLVFVCVLFAAVFLR